jgi:CrcB protein
VNRSAGGDDQPAADPQFEPHADIDPDVGRDDRTARAGSASPALLGAIAAGGILGAEARYGLSLVLPHHDGQFPWSTVVINLTGCLLIGVLMTVLSAIPAPHRLARPFLGVGVLGGYTTYSGFAVDTQQLVLHHRPLLALGYVVLTVLAGASAVWSASALTARVVTARGEPAGLVEQR